MISEGKTIALLRWGRFGTASLGGGFDNAVPMSFCSYSAVMTKVCGEAAAASRDFEGFFRRE